MEEQRFFDVASTKKRLGQQITRFQDFLGDNHPKSDLQIWLSESALLTIDLSKPRELGSSTDPTTPAGFFSYFQTYPLQANKILIYAPCCFNSMERILYGADIAKNYVKNTWGTVQETVDKTLSKFDQNFNRLVDAKK
jgi:hypothetical protein